MQPRTVKARSTEFYFGILKGRKNTWGILVYTNDLLETL
jgi:hypothetical protein